MGILRLSKLEKLKIHSYRSPKRTGVGDTFEVMFNPETYSVNYQNVYDRKQGINTSGRTAQYAMSSPSRLNLTLILDGTGVGVYGLSILGKSTDVYQQVQEFLRLTYRMDGDIHEPKFLTIRWGDLTFKCRLESVDVRYSLFDKSGIPLRAELTTAFLGDLEQSERLKLENKNSPDLTHTRIVGAHDLLPLMCEKIYGSPHYYIQVAKANNLLDFRNLKPGQEIFFPPIEK
ncbi:MAG: LysM peptidoglycan-binding domain-containing protein [Bacteroidota bacterium]